MLKPSLALIWSAALWAALQPATLRGGELKVLSYNVAAIPVVFPAWRTRREAIIRHLRGSAYDIVALQEAWRDADARALAQGSGLPHQVRCARRFPVGAGLAVASRFPILEWRQRDFALRDPALSPEKGGAPIGEAGVGPGREGIWPSLESSEALANKGVLMTRVLTPQGPLDVYNTHLVADYPPVRHRSLRLIQLFELAQVIETFSQRHPFLILGDLNTGPGEADFEAFKGLLGLKDACLAGGVDTCGRTGGQRRIDHVLFSREARQGWAKARAVLTGTIPGTLVPYSDHLGVEARLNRRILSLRLKPDPRRRLAALARVEAAIAAISDSLAQRGKKRIPGELPQVHAVLEDGGGIGPHEITLPAAEVVVLGGRAQNATRQTVAPDAEGAVGQHGRGRARAPGQSRQGEPEMVHGPLPGQRMIAIGQVFSRPALTGTASGGTLSVVGTNVQSEVP